MIAASPKKTAPWYKTEGINGATFATKKALEELVRTIVNAAHLGVPLAPLHHEFFLALLSHHPEWADKSAGGVRNIEVRMNTGAHFANRGLWLVRNDGTAVDISWPVAIAAKPIEYPRLLADAARHAIAPQIAAARAVVGRICAICGGPITDEVHVDHRPPQTFSALLKEWASCHRRPPTLTDCGTYSMFANEADQASWTLYHRLFADLQAAHPKCNMSQGIGQ